MRTNIDIDDALMQRAMEAGGFSTKKETVEAALVLLSRQREGFRKLRALRGKLKWEGNLDQMRQGRFEDPS
jgi:Arc/MetJ family transcription regulator